MRFLGMKSILSAMMLMSSTMAFAQENEHLLFNEVMQSNIDYLLVEKDFPDSWVELYNPSNEAINIGGFSIGEHADRHNAYTFPQKAGSVPAKGHLVIYCDKVGSGLHTSFRIDSGNASLYLFDKAGVLQDSLLLEKMPAPNIAFGRVSDGAETWQYELTPTAGQSNTGEGSTLLLPDPLFSVSGGVFSEPVQLTISIPQAKEGEEIPADTKVYYTVDGTEPTLSSRSIAQSQTFRISNTTVIRAKLISASALPSISIVNSYIFHPRETELPVVSIVTPNEYIYGNELGIANSVVADGSPNYMQKWRRPINIEFYDMRNGGQQSFNQLGETAISGVSTREQPQKSFKVYANKRFGKKTYKGNFWTDKPEVKKVKSFVLRSGGNNSFTTRINDALVQKVFGTHVENLDWQAYQPVIVYINGVYRGEYGMRERSDADYVEANYDGLDEIEEADETSYQSPEAGSLFASFRNAYRNASTSYEELEEQMDMDNFANSLIAEIYAQNTDFPTNNVSMWRPTEEGGKWRWILKDMDRAGMSIALYPFSFDMFNYLFNPDDLMFGGMYHFDLYKKMSTLPPFQGKFIDRAVAYLGDFLKPELVNALVDSMSNEIYEELKYTFYAYNCTADWSRYKQNMKTLKTFFTDRPNYIYTQMNNYFGLGGAISMAVSNATDSVSVNDIRLTEGNFQGKCFARRAISLNSGMTDQGWKMTVTHLTDAPTVYTFSTPEISILPSDFISAPTDALSFETYTIEVENTGDNDFISTPVSITKVQIYNLNGQHRQELKKGVNIIRQQDGTVTKVIRRD